MPFGVIVTFPRRVVPRICDESFTDTKLHTLNLLRNLPRSEISPAESPNRRYREKISCGISRGAKFLLQNLLIGDTGRKSPAESPAERNFSRGISRRAKFLLRNLPQSNFLLRNLPESEFSPAESPAGESAGDFLLRDLLLPKLSCMSPLSLCRAEPARCPLVVCIVAR